MVRRLRALALVWWYLVVQIPRGIVAEWRRATGRVGHLRAEDPLARHVDHVLLNGRRIDRVVELNDVAGWLVHYDETIRILDGCLVSHHRFGTVEVVWRQPDPWEDYVMQVDVRPGYLLASAGSVGPGDDWGTHLYEPTPSPTQTRVGV